MLNRGAKGRRLEWRSREFLESAGYFVVRSAGSRGLFDLVAFSAKRIVLVQVRANRSPSPAERAALAAVPAPRGTVKTIHIWRDRARMPLVRVA